MKTGCFQPVRRVPSDLTTVRIDAWWLCLDQLVPQPLWCSADELQRAERMLPQVRQRFLASRTALRYLLGQATRQPPAELVFAYGPYGKPWLPQAPQVQFNLSHSEGLGLLAIAPCAIGVDVEQLDRKLDPLPLAQRFFPAVEADYLAQLDPTARQSAFLRSWVMKEALLKATGQGLAGQLTELAFDHGQRRLQGSDRADWHCQLLEVGGAIAAVASAEPAVLDLRTSPWSMPGHSV